MNSPENSIQPAQAEASTPSGGAENELLPEPNASMQEFYQLQQDLLKVSLLLTAIIFVSVWIFYSLNIALNYLIGACTGVVYLKMLARNVEQLGRQKKRIGKTQLAVFIGLIILASQWNQLQILPIFLGFLTYKAAIIVYMFRTLDLPSSSN
ncbi:MAG: ATP synthase subunit I [Oculatellaceae cyanobacterium Prado106]|nr:ATP synthase subunit I [Oculatellaceae cyanobacterium Prado106]